MSQLPTLGRTVLYRLTADDAAQVNKRRTDAHQSGIAQEDSGAVVHSGNRAAEGQVFPAVVVRVWEGGSTVNLQVLLDGNDVLWATSRPCGEDVGTWAWPERV